MRLILILFVFSLSAFCDSFSGKPAVVKPIDSLHSIQGEVFSPGSQIELGLSGPLVMTRDGNEFFYHFDYYGLTKSPSLSYLIGYEGCLKGKCDFLGGLYVGATMTRNMVGPVMMLAKINISPFGFRAIAGEPNDGRYRLLAFEMGIRLNLTKGFSVHLTFPTLWDIAADGKTGRHRISIGLSGGVAYTLFPDNEE